MGCYVFGRYHANPYRQWVVLMPTWEVRGQQYTINELSELSGIQPATLRYRLRRGYPVEQAVKPVATNESVEQFAEASYYLDWIGMPINDLHKIYWRWSIEHGYSPLQKQGFSRHLLTLYPQLKTVPNRIDSKCQRVIRLRG